MVSLGPVSVPAAADEGFGPEDYRQWFSTSAEIAPNGQPLSDDGVQQCIINPTFDLTE